MVLVFKLENAGRKCDSVFFLKKRIAVSNSSIQICCFMHMTTTKKGTEFCVWASNLLFLYSIFSSSEWENVSLDFDLDYVMCGAGFVVLHEY